MRILWIFFLILVFILNLKINNLMTISGNRFDFDLERINLTNPNYLKSIENYQKNDLIVPYKLRQIVYGRWQTVFLWIDSTLKYLSPSFWLQILGYSGMVLIGLGMYQMINAFELKYWYILSWIGVVLASSGLGIMIDSKKSVVLAAPAIGFVLFLGLKNRYFKIIGWWWVGLIIIDILLK